MTFDEMGAIRCAQMVMESLTPAQRAEVLQGVPEVAELLDAVGDTAGMLIGGGQIAIASANWYRIAMAYHNAKAPQ